MPGAAEGHLATSLGPECSHGLAWWKQEPPHPAPGAGLHPRRPHLLLLPLLTGLPTRPASTGQLHVALGAWCSGTPSESLCTACSEAGAGGRRAPRGLGWAGAEGGVGSSAQSCPHAAPGLTCGPVRGRWPGEGPCRPLGQGVHLADIRVDACPEGRTRAGPWPPSPHGLSHPRLLRLLARTPAVSAREAASTGARSRAFRQARPRPGPTPAVHGDRRSTPSPVAGHGVPRPGPGWQCVWGGGGAAPGCSGWAATGTPEGPRRRAPRAHTGPGSVQRGRPLLEPRLPAPGPRTRAGLLTHDGDTATWSSCVRTALLALSACSRSSRSLFCSSDSNSSNSSWGRKAQGDADSGGPAEASRAPPRRGHRHRRPASEGGTCPVRPPRPRVPRRLPPRTRSVTPPQARHSLLRVRGLLGGRARAAAAATSEAEPRREPRREPLPPGAPPAGSVLAASHAALRRSRTAGSFLAAHLRTSLLLRALPAVATRGQAGPGCDPPE